MAWFRGGNKGRQQGLVERPRVGAHSGSLLHMGHGRRARAPERVRRYCPRHADDRGEHADPALGGDLRPIVLPDHGLSPGNRRPHVPGDGKRPGPGRRHLQPANQRRALREEAVCERGPLPRLDRSRRRHPHHAPAPGDPAGGAGHVQDLAQARRGRLRGRRGGQRSGGKSGHEGDAPRPGRLAEGGQPGGGRQQQDLGEQTRARAGPPPDGPPEHRAVAVLEPEPGGMAVLF
mmetsp:Transcript_32604/g.101098  ORF Transcript_32604/g.101098 Transcript_32604/m.101098 type:complete len:233 (-) Transcript_32604:917-1615(-)